MNTMTRTNEVDTSSYESEVEEHSVAPLSFVELEMIGGGAMVVNAE